MNTKEETTEQLKAQLDKWNAKIDELEAKARQSEASMRQKYLDQVAELKTKREKISRDLDDLGSKAGDAWDAIKDGANRFGEEVEKTAREVESAVR